MHILYLVPHVPNPTKIRSHYQILGLIEAGHRVTIATLNRSLTDEKSIAKLHERGLQVIEVKLPKHTSLWNAFTALLQGLPLQAKFMWSSQLMDEILASIKNDPPDMIHVEHLRMAFYGIRLLNRRAVLWDAVDYLSSLYGEASHHSHNIFTRIIYGLEAKLLKPYEKYLSAKFPLTLVISQKDQFLFQENSNTPHKIIYQPQGFPLSKNVGDLIRRADTLVITGTLNYHPNIAAVKYFVQSVFPLVQDAVPNIRLQLVGANPDKSILALQLEDTSVEITGFVDSIAAYLQKATVALAPVLYGSGIQIKVLEAFMTGTPLVATSVALRGLDVQHEREVLIADTPDAFANAVIRLLTDTELRERLGAAGRKYVEENHNLYDTTQKLVEHYQHIIKTSSEN
ncbi:MAG: glycosyltransferase family 4 protein [Chloroflexi bacterium]|nr:glycosyltransferase family 4 protein [Chloroflexota bacterium]MCC6895042.1 glycosyltransferase [Anaerolineae bacterium]